MQCEHCGGKFRTDDGLAGKTVACPKCGKIFKMIPLPDSSGPTRSRPSDDPFMGRTRIAPGSATIGAAFADRDDASSPPPPRPAGPQAPQAEPSPPPFSHPAGPSAQTPPSVTARPTEPIAPTASTGAAGLSGQPSPPPPPIGAGMPERTASPPPPPPSVQPSAYPSHAGLSDLAAEFKSPRPLAMAQTFIRAGQALLVAIVLFIEISALGPAGRFDKVNEEMAPPSGPPVYVPFGQPVSRDEAYRSQRRAERAQKAQADLQEILEVRIVVVLVLALVTMAGFILYLIWLAQCYKNLPALGALPNMTPGWAVGCHFIPFLNLYKPYHAMSDIWNGSETQGPKTGTSSSANIVALWWGLWIGQGVIGTVASNMAGETTAKIYLTFEIISSVAMLAFLAVMIMLTWEVTRRQEARYDELAGF